MESNDSPEILDRGETSDMPDLLSGDVLQTRQLQQLSEVNCTKATSLIQGCALKVKYTNWPLWVSV